MTAGVVFEPGCIELGSGWACGPGGVTIRLHGKCWCGDGKEDHRFVMREPNCLYWGTDFSCECGDAWEDGELRPRPFKRGWRKEAQERFERAWDAALPEGTTTIRDDGPDGVYEILGVRLPDGTEVWR
jgi:hypothetical protein